MTKKRVLIILIITLVLALIGVLFGAVFCLRNQTVVVVGEDVTYTNQAIIETAGLKQGSSIFLLDKDKAIERVEKTFPDLKVIQIKTLNPISIEIKVRKRYETYYYKYLGQYYVLDEDLKVLSIKENAEDVQNLIEIILNLDNINETTNVTDFVGSNAQKNMSYNLFVAIYETQYENKTDTIKDAHNKMSSLISSISFDLGYTINGESFNRLIITTKQGMKFDIGKATEELERKINVCFAVLNDDEVTDNTKGKVEITYNSENKEIVNFYKGE